MQPLQFELVKKGKNTDIYNVLNEEGTILGRIRWYWPWRQYVFAPGENTDWSRSCMDEITTFLAKLAATVIAIIIIPATTGLIARVFLENVFILPSRFEYIHNNKFKRSVPAALT